MDVSWLLWCLLAIPAAAAGACLLLPSARAVLGFVVGVVAVEALAAGAAACSVFAREPMSAGAGWLYLDALSAYHLALLEVVFCLSSVYACIYFAHERAEGAFSVARARRFGALWLGSLAAMVLVLVSNNLGIAWVGIEATTLLTAFLICTHVSAGSLEATWKYLIMCSVGVAFAFIGTMLIAAAAGPAHLSPGDALLWTHLRDAAKVMDPALVKMGFVFLLVGYGTKTGLAPMHSWLPDAHSQAPAPVSAVFSGFLLNTALYCILRHVPLVEAATGSTGWALGLLTGFGVISVFVAGVFIVFQQDAKRLLAYSSVEHMGIIALGVGLGGLGVFAAMFHALSHSFCKPLAFFSAGRLGQLHGTHDLARLAGSARSAPLWGRGFFLSLLALIGVAPFAIFMSEFQILRAAADGGQFVVLVAFLAGAGIVFVGALKHAISAAWGQPPIQHPGTPQPTGLVEKALVVLPLGVLLVLGVWMPPMLRDVLNRVSDIIREGCDMPEPIQLRNAQAVPAADVPLMGIDEFRLAIVRLTDAGARISALFGHPAAGGRLTVFAILADDRAGTLHACSTVVGRSYPALTVDVPQAHWFERELAEQWGVRPMGHPWMKPIRFQPPLRSGAENPTGKRPTIGVTDFFQVDGEEVHEVAVGPVHAGVIEPGHFRFQCHGENVLHLEISLGYQHRGVERAMAGGPTPRTIHYAETLAGDTTIGHATAYCQLLEALSGCAVPARAEALRGVALELERVANHVGDLGALAGDVGYLPTASYCGRIRGDVLNVTALLCGNRFGRGMVRPGGVGFDVDDARIDDAAARLATIARDTAVAVNLLWDSPSVLARFEGTGRLSPEIAAQIGLVGPAARACGLERDVRNHHPHGIYRFAHIPLGAYDTGDVFARAFVRWLEVQRSLAFAVEQLHSLPADAAASAVGPLAGDRLAVSLVEGWRGEICHVALTDDRGRLARYKVVDPSFHNWFGLALALRDQPISDFPLCNKSFNLSYCGHDL